MLNCSIKSAILVVLAAALLAGCVNYRERGDLARAKGHWDEAAISYERAIEDSDDPAEIAALKPLLEEARQKASAAHLDSAETLFRARDYAGARREMEAAMRFQPTPELEAFRRRLDAEEGSHLLAAGRTALDAGDWDEAVADLQRAQELAPTEEGSRLLAQASSQARDYHEASFARLVEDARTAMRERRWTQAGSLYEAAHAHGSTPLTLKEQQFCGFMASAESAAAHGSYGAAERDYHRAIELGIDSEYVRARILQTIPHPYVVTVHGAVILPFKPQSHRPWDGPKGGTIPGSGRMVAYLTGLTGPEGYLAAKATEAVTRAASAATEAPDCFLLVSVDDRTWGGLPTVDQDDFLPSWNLAVRVSATTEDKRIFRVEIRDKDVSDHDNVGDVQLVLGDLVSLPGAHEIPLFDAAGLHGGGILVLKLSVARE